MACNPTYRQQLNPAILTVMFRATTLIATILVQAAAVANADDRSIPACTDMRCGGTRIRDNLGILQFCVPRGLRVQREFGEHGDVHYTMTVRLHGQPFELFVTSGLYFPGRLPDWASGCDLRRWYSPESKGEDCRIERVAARSRYVTLNAPMGYAVYKDVPPDIAARFDRMLDSLCWRSFQSAVGKR
jgi:hypothetical protein